MFLYAFILLRASFFAFSKAIFFALSTLSKHFPSPETSFMKRLFVDITIKINTKKTIKFFVFFFSEHYKKLINF